MYAQVILSLAHSDVDQIFDYEIPLELYDKLTVGMRVQVPFGMRNSKIEGYVVGIKDETEVPQNKIKYVVSLMDRFAVFSEKEIQLAWWMKEKYYTTLTQCLQTIMPPGINLKNEEKLVFLCKSKQEIDEIKTKMKLQEKSLQQLLVIEFIELYGESTPSFIQKNLKISASPVKTLLKNGILAEKISIKRKNLDIKNPKGTLPFTFNEEQKKAYEGILSEKENPILIHGVTGSGKTEVYLQVIDSVIKEGKQAIVLVPEISLTPQLFYRFQSRFKDKVLLTHSRMSQGERHEVWQRAKNGEVSVVIGPRSAVFMPFENLGIIIMDEEHEGSYKSDTTPKYDAREVAEHRCKQYRATMVYGSATPSLQTYYRATHGDITLYKLNQRALGQPMPDIKIVDMRQELANGNMSIFSRDLYNSIGITLQKKEQIMLLINRRGFSTFVSCRKCGEVITCDRCNVSYTYHHSENHLMCHYCGSKTEIPKTCPKCGSKYIKYFGAGTQRVEQEIRKLFPQARVLRMDMDTTSKKESHGRILSSFKRGEADILIGTQMIAKGHDFPKVTLVGVIAADLSLNVGDYRSGENTYQLLTQVSGRAGRGTLPGDVIIQTYSPEHYIIKLAEKGTYEEFYEKESRSREILLYPPYSNIFSIMVLGKDEKGVIEYINMLKGIMDKNNKEFDVLGPSPSAISKIKDEYRWRILAKGEDEDKLRAFVTSSVNELTQKHKRSGILINMSMNPQNIV